MFINPRDVKLLYQSPNVLLNNYMVVQVPTYYTKLLVLLSLKCDFLETILS